MLRTLKYVQRSAEKSQNPQRNRWLAENIRMRAQSELMDRYFVRVLSHPGTHLRQSTKSISEEGYVSIMIQSKRFSISHSKALGSASMLLPAFYYNFVGFLLVPIHLKKEVFII